MLRFNSLKRQQTIFFGANDACVPTHDQHVPLEQYKKNLQSIIQHPATRAQNPYIIIVTPPPVNEYQLEGFDNEKGTQHPSRTAAFTKKYSEAAREVGASLDVPVADVWAAFMATTGWKEGQPLVGSRELPSNEQFANLFTDGPCTLSTPSLPPILTALFHRIASDASWIPPSVR
jgi:lysophospholipase L1-like esterase